MCGREVGSRQQYVLALCSLMSVLEISYISSNGKQFYGHALKSYWFWCRVKPSWSFMFLTVFMSVLALCLIVQCCLTRKTVVVTVWVHSGWKLNVSFPLVLVGSGIRPCGKRETPLLGTEHVISAFCVWSALKLVVVLLWWIPHVPVVRWVPASSHSHDSQIGRSCLDTNCFVLNPSASDLSMGIYGYVCASVSKDR